MMRRVGSCPAADGVHHPPFLPKANLVQQVSDGQEKPARDKGLAGAQGVKGFSGEGMKVLPENRSQDCTVV